MCTRWGGFVIYWLICLHLWTITGLIKCWFGWSGCEIWVVVLCTVSSRPQTDTQLQQHSSWRWALTSNIWTAQHIHTCTWLPSRNTDIRQHGTSLRCCLGGSGWKSAAFSCNKWLFCHHWLPILYDFLSSVEKEDTLKNVWVLDPIVLQNVMFYVLQKKERFGAMTEL